MDRLPALGSNPATGAARRDDFADICLSHFKCCWPIGQWLIDEVAN